jgi:tetratricopeptide (TPR) repeat protein
MMHPACVNRALELQPLNALAHVAAGYIALKRDDVVEAIRYLTRAVKMENDPKATLYANLYLGITYLKREMHEDASTFLRQAVALGPNLTEAYYYLGRALYRTGMPEEAKQCWRTGSSAAKRTIWGVRCVEILTAVEAGKAFPHAL